ncbi:MAG: class I SAM-dependent methyltransferase [Bdellovibrionales bacterium]|nr:class I SAM-dependent methyltransferase [Bdellovibrionales bacterium]
MSENHLGWALPAVLEYFEHHRNTTSGVYSSEWFFLKDCLFEGMTVLDIGCAQGGFAAVLGEHLANFSYTGVDISSEMIERAQAKFPEHEFHVTGETDFEAVSGRTFDLVICLGILHLNENWRDVIELAWSRTGSKLILDLRETVGESIEDKSRAYFRMDFNGGDTKHTEFHLPYIIVNTAEALQTVTEKCCGLKGISRFGYMHPIRGAAVAPLSEVMMSTYLIAK